MEAKIKRVGRTNAAEVSFLDWIILFSYGTPVAAYQEGVGYFKTDKKYSRTTSKHIDKWLDGVKASERNEDFFLNLSVKRIKYELA